MYAVFSTGGKQYRAAPDDQLVIERLAGEPGDKVSFDQVLMIGGEGEPQVGRPHIEGARVEGEVVEQKRGRTILVFRRKRRKNFRRMRGHRQYHTLVKITGIEGAGAAAKPKTKAKAKPKAKAQPETPEAQED